MCDKLLIDADAENDRVSDGINHYEDDRWKGKQFRFDKPPDSGGPPPWWQDKPGSPGSLLRCQGPAKENTCFLSLFLQNILTFSSSFSYHFAKVLPKKLRLLLFFSHYYLFSLWNMKEWASLKMDLWGRALQSCIGVVLLLLGREPLSSKLRSYVSKLIIYIHQFIHNLLI